MNHSHVKIYSDGGARGNPGPAAIGIHICDSKENLIQEHGETIGDTTNNVAEYTGVIVGLELAKKLGAKKVDYFVDSQLVAHQINGIYKVKTPHIQTLFLQVKKCMQGFEKVTFTHLRREHPGMRLADRLVNAALDGEM